MEALKPKSLYCEEIDSLGAGQCRKEHMGEKNQVAEPGREWNSVCERSMSRAVEIPETMNDAGGKLEVGWGEECLPGYFSSGENFMK